MWKVPASIFENIAFVENLALAIAGVVGIIIGLCTLRKIERQSKSGEIAANAAMLNAQAVIDAERPWFVAAVERSGENPGLYRIRITNRGRSPAQLYEIFAEHALVDRPENLPVPPRYQSLCLLPDSRFFASGDSFTDREHLEGFNPEFMIEHESKSQFDFLIVYGKVTYKDTFTGGRANEVIHETRWCYAYQAPQQRFVPCGPDEYNGYRDQRQGPN
ncbi:MAG: hypothetical protein ABSH49_24405 [Bryobacteraceae bacterium]|jgi:hypothetical protein